MQDEDALREGAKDCVHCGFCLPACPTYQLWGEEMDSPRGRIYLVNQILDGAPLNAAAAEHFDRCLGCMACMTACPSGVQYDQLIEAARVWTEEARSAPPSEASPVQVNAATARVLAAEGCDVIIPRGQGCCGALSLHSGREAEASAFARRTIATFEQAGVDAVVVNSAGCGSAMKEYERLLRGADSGWAERAAEMSGKVRDLAEFLADLGPVARRHPLPVTAAYHDACHLAHAQRITKQPRELLRAIPGLNLVEVADAGNCCGSAGVYNLLQPEAASELGVRKAESVLATGAPLLISANPGCSLQIASALAAHGKDIAVAHTAEVLDASIRGRALVPSTGPM